MLASLPFLGGHLVLDADGRVVEWDESLTPLVGISRSEAIGRLCYQLVGGTDVKGQLICTPVCPLRAALLEGRITSSATLTIRSPLYGQLLVQCRLTALPTGGALAVLQPEMPGGDNLVYSLAGLATLATRLAVQGLPQGFIEALDYLLTAAQASAAELYLVEPEGTAVVLVCHIGDARQAFTQERARFRRGEGFPGLTLATGSLLISGELSREARFIRDSVKREGFRQYISAPIIGPSGCHGGIGLAFRIPRPEIQHLTPVITAVCAVLGLRIEAARAQLHESTRACVARWGESPDLTGAVRSLLDEVIRYTGATSGEFYLPANGAPAQRVATDSASVPQCSVLARGTFAVCPAWTTERGVVLQGACPQWLLPPRRAREDFGLWCCAPLVYGDRVLGLIRVKHHLPGWLLPHGTLVLLREATTAVSEALRELNQRTRARLTLSAPPVKAIGAAEVHIRCFDGFELELGGRVVTAASIARKRVLTLLKILTTYRGHFLPRDRLIEWLWPESDPETKRPQFHVVVHELRRLLEPAGARHHWKVVVAVDDRYALTSSPSVVVDAEQFEHLLDAACRCEQAGDRQEAMLAYQRAIALYRGDYLEDEASASWCVARRAQLRRRYIDALRRLAVLYREARMWEQSTEVLLRALSLDDLDEELHRELMVTYWASGRRDQAMRQYAACVRALADELGIAPSVETVKLALRIRAQVGISEVQE